MCPHDWHHRLCQPTHVCVCVCVCAVCLSACVNSPCYVRPCCCYTQSAASGYLTVEQMQAIHHGEGVQLDRKTLRGLSKTIKSEARVRLRHLWLAQVCKWLTACASVSAAGPIRQAAQDACLRTAAVADPGHAHGTVGGPSRPKPPGIRSQLPGPSPWYVLTSAGLPPACQ
jgi:hypothetical protein